MPLLGSVSAAKKEWKPEEVEQWLPYPFLPNSRNRIFAFKVDGDCMEPTLQDGDIVFVDKQFDMNDVDVRIVVVRIDGEETTLKRFYKRDSFIELRPDNPKHPPITVSPDEEIEIVGMVLKKVGEG